jgi:hypothetical protein
MKMKFNKDALLKHRFWIMLGVAGFLIFTGILYLEFVYGGPETARNNIKKVEEKSKQKKDRYVSRPMIDDIEKKSNMSIKNETDTWYELYKAQAPIFTFAQKIEETFHFYDGKFAVDIKVTKAGDPGTWPEDTKTLMHGTLVTVEPDYFVIRARNKETKKLEPVTFQRTDSVIKINLVEENKQVFFTDFFNQRAGKLLAVTYQNGRYFNDLLTANERALFTTTYQEQIFPILKSVDPVDEKLNGVVQLRDWLYTGDEPPPPTAKFFRYVNGDWQAYVGKNISREIWIAQENLWIQKEIYRIIRSANDELCKFVGKGGKKRNQAYSFTNPNFRVELNLDDKGKLSFTMTNLLDRQQSIDMKFRVLLDDTPGIQPEIVAISGNPLKPKGSHTQVVDIEKSPRNGVYSVEQVLTWQTAAIKRIDQVSIGSNASDEISHSHRTFVDGLKPFDEKDPINQAAAGKTAGSGTTPGMTPGMTPGGSGRETKGPPPVPIGPGPGAPPGGIGGFGGAGAGGNLGPIELGLWNYRYVDVTEQSRRVPIAVVLIIDQDHVDRVLTAFNNSKLRFLLTQVLVNQYLGSLQPPVKLDANAPGGAFPNAGSGGRDISSIGMRGGRPPIVGPGPTPGFNGPGLGQTEEGESSGQETNLEIVIYGVMTLYQRYPAVPRTAVAPAPPKS